MKIWHGIFLAMCIQSAACAEVFNSLDLALFAPEKVTSLSLQSNPKIKQLPREINQFTNLNSLNLSCLPSLSSLPEELGQLKKLEQLEINNGKNCTMNVTIPVSIGQLSQLKFLVLYGALDGRDVTKHENFSPKSKSLPKTLAQLTALQVLDLGRNGMKTIPAEIAALHNLEKLELNYNNLTELPEFISTLKKLRYLAIKGNDRVKLPRSLTKLEGLRIEMGNNRLSFFEQTQLRKQFPHIVFSFKNDQADNNANEE
jgi:Leucine-rich repeat (LRR) protein